MLTQIGASLKEKALNKSINIKLMVIGGKFMKEDMLIQILNSNQELLRGLAQCGFFQKNFVGMLRNIESIIPKDSRENFYTNLKTLRLNFNNETMMENCCFGAYSHKSNQIYMDKGVLAMVGRNISVEELDFDESMLMTMYHELLHMASDTRGDIYNEVTGFQNIKKTEEGEFLYADVLDGMSEGFTEYLTLLAFGKGNNETFSIYGKQVNIMSRLSDIVGLDTMKKAYFNNKNGMQDIERALQKIDGKRSHDDLYFYIESDFAYPQGHELFDPTLSGKIDEQLSELSETKIKIMQKNEEQSMDI